MRASTDLVVIDASLALKWVLDEPESGVALQLLAEWLVAGIQPIGPSWLPCEIANVLYQYIRNGTFTLDEAERLLDAAMSIDLRSSTQQYPSLATLGSPPA
jgi:predicted nucleic acid-binding protein